ncbi:MAG: proline--tRNA ligase [Thermodesulfobacteriota bacterium]
MRLSKMFLPTERRDRSEAVVASHRLMLRAGMIRQLTSGVYSYLPLGLRAVRKVAQIVREEMDRAGAQEVFLPALQPADLWRESGRWDHFGPELMRLRDRNDREFCLGPTHEEVITDLVRREVRSYRQLPINLYQIQTKFRDERRPRFGVMRGREFTMKDGYSFDATEEGAEESYRKMYEAYCRIFQRCGLRFRAVEADTGTIGGSFSHEFMVLADSGEDTILICSRCPYAANSERAEVASPFLPPANKDPLPLGKVSTAGMRTVEEVCAYLGVKPTELIKTLIYRTEGAPVAVLVRGDREVNEAKVRRAMGCSELELADGALVELVTGAPAGFAGPVGLGSGSASDGIRILADQEIKGMVNAVVGANEPDAHLINVNSPRDFRVDRYGDFRVAVTGDVCPRCGGGVLEEWRGIEVGHIFKLGTKYSEAMGATFQDDDGVERPMIMGCYGIGIERTVAAAIEQNHDREGVIFPLGIAPFHVILLCLQPERREVLEVSEYLYRRLSEAGVEVLLDDREGRPGSKFKDADLIGIPLRVNVGERMVSQGKVELRYLDTVEVEVLALEALSERIKEILGDQA